MSYGTIIHSQNRRMRLDRYISQIAGINCYQYIDSYGNIIFEEPFEEVRDGIRMLLDIQKSAQKYYPGCDISGGVQDMRISLVA